MKYDYDIITIGLGPAGMAVSIMGSEMGLKVCAIEKRKIGGECMNVGCIPSKSLLRIAETRHAVSKFKNMELSPAEVPKVLAPFPKIQSYLKYIGEKKTIGMFKKTDLILAEGDASFIDAHTVEAGGRKVSAKYIFIATGTKPMIPPVPGIEQVEVLTNENLFELDKIPESMTIIGGGAIGSEMAQAFSRLGTKCKIVQMDPYLVPVGDPEAGALLEKKFNEEGIEVYNSKKIAKIEKHGDKIHLFTEDGLELVSDKLLAAAGRKYDFSSLKLENVGIKVGKRGIEVDKYLRTNIKNIYAVGDCNGQFLLSHAAMYQGMVGIMNSMSPWGFKRNFRKTVIPWTVFTDPQISYVGMLESELKKQGVKYETIDTKYEDYGAAVAEGIPYGFVKAFVSPFGKIYGVSIVGEGSGEMINEWALAIQNNIRLHKIMMLPHSFPTMGFMSKRIAEIWMMNKMKSELLKKICRFMLRLG